MQVQSLNQVDDKTYVAKVKKNANKNKKMASWTNVKVEVTQCVSMFETNECIEMEVVQQNCISHDAYSLLGLVL